MSSSSSASYSTATSDDDLDALFGEREDRLQLQGYLFQPTRAIDTDDSDNYDSDSSDSTGNDTRLLNSDWCTCEHCQVMDREVECVCCHEISQVMDKNRLVSEEDDIDISCITNNPGFEAVCLNRWVLEAAWYQYRQQYGREINHEAPEHKKNRHIAYRQLVRWCWGCLGKEIRVVLPSCAVMCIRAHFPPPGLEENFEFTGFLYADE